VIVREYATCGECGTAHVLRVGMGAEPVQEHRFACTSCGQEMSIRLVDGEGWTFGPNTMKSDWSDDAPIINLHPSFVFSKDEIGSAAAFPSLDFGVDIIKAIMDARERAGLSRDIEDLAGEHPPRARITAEWDQLRAAWSLARNGKTKLAEKRLRGFIPTAGYPDPPDTIVDWLFQFVGSLMQPYFEQHFEGLFRQLQTAMEREDFGRFLTYYDEHMSQAHARRYFEGCKAYLGAFSEFSQVHHLVTANADVGDGDGHAAASANFDVTRMIYGNAFEAFGDNVEVLVALNNLVEGRPFDQLCSITLAAYLQTDKAGRCKAVTENAAMADVCGEFDNRVRNASHHGGMVFDRAAGTVEYRAGRGGQGEVRTMGYTTYLARCTKLFIQLMLLFRLEILLAHKFGTRPPL
jgi:hypothetical protein